MPPTTPAVVKRSRKQSRSQPLQQSRTAATLTVCAVDLDDSLVESDMPPKPRSEAAASNHAGNSHDDTIVLDSDDEDEDIIIMKEVKKPRMSVTMRAVTQTTQTERDVQIVGSTMNVVVTESPPRAGPSAAANPRKRVAGPSPKSAPPEKKTEKPELKCPVCLETFNNIMSNNVKIMSTKCGHLFCEPCLRDSMQVNSKLCPTCRSKLSAKTHYHQVFLS